MTETSPNSAASNPPPPSSTPFAWPEKWKDQLPEDIRGEDSLKSINDIPALAKSYVHAQKHIGAEKISIPSKHATEDDWKRVFHKLGLPEKAEEYNFDVPKTVEFKEEFIKGLKEQAYKQGILPKQMTPLLNWFAELSGSELAKEKTAKETAYSTSMKELQNEWGQAYEQKVKMAQNAFNHYGDSQMKEYLEKTGLAGDPNLLRIFSKIGEDLTDDTLPDGSPAQTGKLTPSEAIKQYNQILMDANHPYHLSGHPGHKGAVAEVQSLFEMAYPELKNS